MEEVFETMPITGKNLRMQKYPFRPKFMAYLIENSNAEIMQKFHRCCKHLYQMAPYFIVDFIEFALSPFVRKRRFENERYNGCLDFMTEGESEAFVSKLHNIWVTKKVRIFLISDEMLNKIVRCDASEITVSVVRCPFETFKILAKSGNVEYLNWTAIGFPDGNPTPLEDILALVPNATSIIHVPFMYSCHVTPNTMKKLLEIPWKQKINKFDLRCLDGELDVETFYKFVEVRFVLFLG